MNRKTFVLGLALTVVTTPAPAAGIPLPGHRPKNLSSDAFQFVLQQLRRIKQFDLKTLGIPLAKSLRLAGAFGDPAHPFGLDAVSPKDMETMLAWYHERLPDWKVSFHFKGKTATLTSPRSAGTKVTILNCSGGTYQLYPCGSVVRFYNTPPVPPAAP